LGAGMQSLLRNHHEKNPAVNQPAIGVFEKQVPNSDFDVCLTSPDREHLGNRFSEFQ
jgi:hypothetical protein